MSDEKQAHHIDLSADDLFGNDAGEDESPEVLASYFIDQLSFKYFLSSEQKLSVCMSRKGMGKSALLSKLAYDLRQKPQSDKDVVIQTTGSDLVGLGAFPATDFNLLQNYWKQILCARINLELGKRIGLAFTDTSMALVENAEISGFKGRNLVGALIARLCSDKLPLKVTASIPPNQLELLKRACTDLADASVWLLIDDIDSTFIDSHDWKARISAFFSACRSLVRDAQGLRVRSSVRTDVWSILRENEDLDKFEQYITEIKWSKPELRRMLAKKVSAYVQRHFGPNTLWR